MLWDYYSINKQVCFFYHVLYGPGVSLGSPPTIAYSVTPFSSRFPEPFDWLEALA